VLLRFGERTCLSLSYGDSSSPTSWKRGSPLSPVVGVVGEGQVNLVSGRYSAMGKVFKALWVMIDEF